MTTATEDATPSRSDLTIELPTLPNLAAIEEASPPAASRLYVVDLLRFCAAMLVVAYHYIFAGGRQTWGANTADLFTAPARIISSYGWMGVDLFFLISGFVICMSGWGRTISEFFTSRVVRLVPAYLLAVVVTSVVLVLWPSATGSPRLPDMLGNLSMVQSLLHLQNVDEPYWTLLVELKFYVLFAVVVHFGVTYRRVVAFCMLWTTVALFAYATDFGPLWVVLEPRYASYFVAGIAFYLMHRFGPTLLLWGIIALSFLINTASLDARVGALVKGGVPMSWNVTVLILAVFYVLMAGVALRWFSWVRWRGLATMGALTYPLYLLHMAIGKTVIRHLRDHVPHWLLLGTVVGGALAAAYLVYRFLERPMGRALRRGLRASFDRIRTEPAAPDGVERRLTSIPR